MTRVSRILTTLTAALHPTHLEVIDESHQHHVPAGSESHFKIIVISDLFENKSTIERRRSVQELLAAEFQQGLHALSIQPLTPREWSARNEKITFQSPDCAHKKV